VDDSPTVFVLSDQCFPPVLSPEGEGECIKIMCIEDGRVMELLDAFIDATKSFVIPAGSVVVLCSASHLAALGTEAYAAEFSEAKFKLTRIMGDGIQLLHGFPILFAGTRNRALIKSIMGIEHWFCTVSEGRDIALTRKHFIALAYGKTLTALSADDCTGSLEAPAAGQSAGSPVASTLFPTRLVLPTLEKNHEKTVFESPQYYNVPVQLEAASEADERNIIDVFIQDLNRMFLADLATEYSVDREQETEGTGDALEDKRLVLVGSSHATRLASAYDDMELEVVDLSVPGWHALPVNVATMSAELSKVLAEDFDGETIIIYQLFDNLCYRVCDASGNRSLPVRGEDCGIA
jgi:hypothetical protein